MESLFIVWLTISLTGTLLMIIDKSLAVSHQKNWIIEIKPFLGNLDYLCFIVFVHYKNPENYDFQVNL